MKKKEKTSALGMFPADGNVCVTFYHDNGDILLEAYALEIGLFRFNWHPSLEIMLVLNGSLNAYTEQGIFHLQENDIIVMNPNEGHATLLQAPGTIAMVFHISQQYLEKICVSRGMPVFVCHSNAETRDQNSYRVLRGCVSAIYHSLAQPTPSEPLFIFSQVHMILSLLMRRFSVGITDANPKEVQGASLHRKSIHAMITYIDHNFHKKITLTEMASLYGMTPSYASSYFKSYAGIGFSEYLIRKRLAYAIYMLNSTDESVLDIALDSGFPDTKAFHNAFKKYFNTTPKKYRMVLKASMGANIKNPHPVRLEFRHPVVRRKIEEYLLVKTSPADVL